MHSGSLLGLSCTKKYKTHYQQFSKEVYYLIEYGFVPHVDTILKLSAYFNVSTDYLLCQNNMQDEKMLSTFRQLNDDNKDIILGETKKALRDQRYEESVAAESTLREAKYYPSSGTEGENKIKRIQRGGNEYGMDCSLDGFCYLSITWMVRCS